MAMNFTGPGPFTGVMRAAVLTTSPSRQPLMSALNVAQVEKTYDTYAGA